MKNMVLAAAALLAFSGSSIAADPNAHPWYTISAVNRVCFELPPKGPMAWVAIQGINHWTWETVEERDSAGRISVIFARSEGLDGRRMPASDVRFFFREKAECVRASQNDTFASLGFE
jgi:hypothetical protein